MFGRSCVAGSFDTEPGVDILRGGLQTVVRYLLALSNFFVPFAPIHQIFRIVPHPLRLFLFLVCSFYQSSNPALFLTFATPGFSPLLFHIFRSPHSLTPLTLVPLSLTYCLLYTLSVILRPGNKAANSASPRPYTL